MASATSNASREVGGVFGIALLGAIVTHWFSTDLHKALTRFALPPAVKERIVTLAGHGGGTAASSLPQGVDAAALHRAVDTAFVSGMHVAFIVSAIVLFSGALLAAVFVRSGVPAAEGEGAAVSEGVKAAVSEGGVALGADPAAGEATAWGRGALGEPRPVPVPVEERTRRASGRDGEVV
jgi:hypothetical protein